MHTNGRKPRVPFARRVWLHSKNKPLPTYGVNISESGIFLQTSDPPMVGEEIELNFSIEEHSNIVAIAKVIWVKPFELINVDGRLPGLGAQFTSLDDEAVRQIRAYVTQQEPRIKLVKQENVTQVRPLEKPARPVANEENAFEKAMLLQIKGDPAPLHGFSSKLTEDGLEFHVDYVPDNSIVKRSQQLERLKKLKGTIALPVQIHSANYRFDEDGNQRILDLKLDFTEIVGDLENTLNKLANDQTPRRPRSSQDSGTNFRRLQNTGISQAVIRQRPWVRVLKQALTIVSGVIAGLIISQFIH